MARKVTDAELQDILEFVWSNQDAWLYVPAAQISVNFGLGMGQTYYRMRLLRAWDISVTVDGKVTRLPILSRTSGANGYRLSADPRANAEFRGRVTKDALTRLETGYKETVSVFVATLPVVEQPAMQRKFDRIWKRIIEDIGDAVAANDTLLASHAF